mmetsp:Transcript_54059/g.157024  ORF Transcript_54059/g.157024 Transcript_54059/m.157024 type:complete len:262 (-) Transcript_54059:200-985(-)
MVGHDDVLGAGHVTLEVCPRHDVVGNLNARLLQLCGVVERHVAGRHELAAHFGVQAKCLVRSEARFVHIPNRTNAGNAHLRFHDGDVADAPIVRRAARGHHREVQRSRRWEEALLVTGQVPEQLLVGDELRSLPLEGLRLGDDHLRAGQHPGHRLGQLGPRGGAVELGAASLLHCALVVVDLALRTDEAYPPRRARGLDALAPALWQPPERPADVHAHARGPMLRRRWPATGRRLLLLPGPGPRLLVAVLPVERLQAVGSD